MKMKATALLVETESSNPTPVFHPLGMTPDDVQACLDAKLIEYLGTTEGSEAIVYRLTYEGRILLGDLHRKND